MKRFLTSLLPASVWRMMQKAAFVATRTYYRIVPRAKTYLESSKVRARRQQEGFFEKFCRGKGLDIGYGGDKLCDNCQGWDIEDGDAGTLKGLADNSFDFVYSSHCLEHLDNADEALKNWWRVVKTGGYLILYLPERDLFERKKTLPSRWNTSHKRFFLLDRDELPDTVGVLPFIQRTLTGYEILKADICKNEYNIRTEEQQADGEYSIEIVIRKTH